MTIRDYNEVDILYTLMSYVNVSSSQDMYYTVAHTVLLQLEKIPEMSINDLADLCYTSSATISRFCKDLNCKNFIAFKQEIKIALELAHREIHFPLEEQNKIQENPHYLVDKMYQEAIDSLHKVYKCIEIQQIDKICEIIFSAKKVHMIGYQFNKMISNDFQMKMLKLRKFVYAFVERGDEIQRLDMIDKDSLVIIITVRARQQLMDPLLEKLCEHHPRILVMTMNKEYQDERIDDLYCIDGTESDYSESSIQGTMNFLSVLNLIYIRYGILYGK